MSQAKAEAWCRDNGDMPHFSVSAKDGDGVEQAFNTLAKKSKRILDEWYRPPGIHQLIRQTSRFSNHLSLSLQEATTARRGQDQPA